MFSVIIGESVVDSPALLMEMRSFSLKKIKIKTHVFLESEAEPCLWVFCRNNSIYSGGEVVVGTFEGSCKGPA